MSTIMRYVEHRIRSHPDSDPVVAARCTRRGCTWRARPGLTVEECDTACMAHTGRTGHSRFLRQFSQLAVVDPVR
ncbi:hypothetical protein [Streptomyces sp. NPDC047014]|uniref:hypothetical protein n=1 Tax=Streptomyces sp. NPDC047014 TaxID=3155736 RepID=UPI0033C2B578